jgi:uncharacterized membrane protein
MDDDERQESAFPLSAGLLFGLGLGGVFDGIMLHQVLQWHHMLTSAGYPADSGPNLEVTMLWDGVFHLSPYLFVLLGLLMLWRAAHRTHVRWSGKLLAGTMLIGVGLFNGVEGIIDHHLLGIHHVNETVPPDQWMFWDMGFLSWGALMLLWGWRLLRQGRQATPAPRMDERREARVRCLLCEPELAGEVTEHSRTSGLAKTCRMFPIASLRGPQRWLY